MFGLNTQRSWGFLRFSIVSDVCFVIRKSWGNNAELKPPAKGQTRNLLPKTLNENIQAQKQANFRLNEKSNIKKH